MARESVVVALISVIGGGTIVPLLWGWWQRRKPEAVERADAKEDERAARAAREAVEAVRGVLAELRTERDADRREIAELRARCVTLEGERRA